MRTFLAFFGLFVLLASVVVLGYAAAHASEGDCNMIGDHDTRAECYARRHHSGSECGLIYNNDERRFCRAQAGGRR